jgi:hypothetical protein
MTMGIAGWVRRSGPTRVEEPVHRLLSVRWAGREMMYVSRKSEVWRRWRQNVMHGNCSIEVEMLCI